MNEFNFITFNKYNIDIEVDVIKPLTFTIDTSKNKTFTIYKLNKGTAPQDINIDWGDGSTTTYNNLLADTSNNNCTKTYIGNNIRTIVMTGTLTESKYAVTYYNNTNLISVDGNIFIYYSGVSVDTAYRNYFFSGCSNLQNIDEKLFKFCTTMKNIYEGFRNCTSLQSIPENLFKYNTEITNTQNCFLNCTKVSLIPENLFKYNTVVLNINGCFYGVNIQTIPTNLLKENTKLWNAAGVFSNCASLIDIPSDLFKYNRSLTNVSQCFMNCTSLQNIPENLFKENKLINTINSCFYGCSSIINVPENLFDEARLIWDAGSCFQNNTSITSTVPDLWNTNKWSGITNYNRCFLGCTKATNYASIPSNWKQ